MPNFARLVPGQIYHVCSRGNNREDIFHAAHDRRHFLELYEQRISPNADTYAYCLLPNHFHLLVRFHEPAIVGTAPPSRLLADMLNAYARSFNLDHSRAGALFQRPFRRILVATHPQLVHVVTYIHLNPLRHGLAPDFRRWRFSSYPALLAAGKTRLQREEVLEWFGGRRGFIDAHQSPLPAEPDPALRLESDPILTT
jgi:REP element-mobilizing transposase RayT